MKSRAGLMLGVLVACGAAVILTSGRGSAATAGLLAPGASVLTFVTQRTGVATIVSRSIDGGPLREIVEGGAPQWSPDGRWLLYVVHPSGRGDVSELHAIDSSGDRGHLLVNGTAPSWSPDSTMIAVRDATGRIETVSVSTGSVLRVFRQPTDTTSYSPVWSPGGRWIAFVRESGSARATRALVVVHPNGTGLHPLAASVDYGPVWSPDGRWIAFGGTARNRAALLVEHPDGTGLLHIPATVYHAPSWSPDGRRLAYTELDGSSYVLTLRGEIVRRLPVTGQPVWSPDGRWLAAISLDAAQLVLLHPDGTGLKTPAVAPRLRGIVWAPDSQRLAVTAGVSETDVWDVGLDGIGYPVSQGGQYGYEADSPAWTPTAASNLGRVVSPAIPSDSLVQGDKLLARWPITGIATDGDSVAVSLAPTTGLVPGGTDLWTAGAAAATRIPADVYPRNLTGVSPSSAALARGRLWVQSAFHEMGTNMYTVGFSTLPHPALTPVSDVCPLESISGVCTETPIGDLLADDTLAVFDGWKGPQWWCSVVACPPPKHDGVLYRIDDSRAVPIVKADLELTPLAVDGNRILVDRGAGGLSVYDGNGARLLTVPLTNINEGALAEDDLVAHSAAGLQIFDSQTGTEQRTCPLPGGAHLNGAAAGLAAVTTPEATEVVRLIDCRTIVIGSAPPRPDLARITPAGLFYVQTNNDPTYPLQVTFTSTIDVVRKLAP